MHMKKVLIASDDAHTRAWVANAIEPLDVSTVQIPAGELAVALAKADVNLAIIDGGREPEPLVQMVESAVSEGLEARLILVVESDMLASLRMPARVTSDFLVRGAASTELEARVRTLLWPGEEVSTQELVRIDSLTLNLATYQAYVEGTPVDFTYLEYALFAFLVTHPGRAYSREVLLRRVWGTDYYGGARTVDVHIRRIRSKVGPELSRHLETVRNVGYLWHE